MKFWKGFFFSNKFLLLSKKLLSKAKVPLVKVRFVREQRIFAKGSRGPAKKRSNLLLRHLKLYILSSKLQNSPPLSTSLNLYGINVQKFCDEANIFLKSHYYEDLPLILDLWITKDLNFFFKLNQIRFNHLFYSLDTRFFKFETTSFLIRRSIKTKEISNYYSDNNLKEIILRDFSFLDFWFYIYLFYVIYFFSNHNFLKNFGYSLESNMRIFVSHMYSLNNVYKFKKFKNAK